MVTSSSSAPSVPTGPPQRVLVVEDLEDTRASLQELLHLSLGLEVDTAEDGAKGLAMLRERPYSLVITDLRMPKVSGIEVVRALADHPARSAMRVVMVTTETEVDRVVEALGGGADEYLMKPFTKEAVAEKQYELMDVVLENFTEELAGPRSHVDIMLQFLEEGGISREEADRAEPAPGTMAAIEMIVGGCQRRSALEGLALLSFTESQHGGPDRVAAQVYRELTGYYGFSKRAAETYQLHAEQDVGHGTRQIELIRRYATDQDTQEKVRRAVKLGVTAFTLEWDGHVQAMTSQREFWSGVAPLRLRQPQVRRP